MLATVEPEPSTQEAFEYDLKSCFACWGFEPGSNYHVELVSCSV